MLPKRAPGLENLRFSKRDLVQNGAVVGEGDHLPGDKLLRGLQGSPDHMLDFAAAGVIHPKDGDGANGVVPQNLGEFFRVVRGIRGRAGQEDRAVLQKSLVKLGAGHGGAGSGNQQMNPSVIIRYQWREAELYWPLRGMFRRQRRL